eukprot:TRINITY_DN28566_c0_g1_i1.p1 TRINITY_DN28566_c0_g1~~TRINITY_DN28566_c0_g1_i1.p1  ORF type:complete len:958 (-),score=232.73 TRINITY_DN28566_c0_g1_i1:137-3010(-)
MADDCGVDLTTAAPCGSCSSRLRRQAVPQPPPPPSQSAASPASSLFPSPFLEAVSPSDTTTPLPSATSGSHTVRLRGLLSQQSDEIASLQAQITTVRGKCFTSWPTTSMAGDAPPRIRSSTLDEVIASLSSPEGMTMPAHAGHFAAPAEEQRSEPWMSAAAGGSASSSQPGFRDEVSGAWIPSDEESRFTACCESRDGGLRASAKQQPGVQLAMEKERPRGGSRGATERASAEESAPARALTSASTCAGDTQVPSAASSGLESTGQLLSCLHGKAVAQADLDDALGRLRQELLERQALLAARQLAATEKLILDEIDGACRRLQEACASPRRRQQCCEADIAALRGGLQSLHAKLSDELQREPVSRAEFDGLRQRLSQLDASIGLLRGAKTTDAEGLAPKGVEDAKAMATKGTCPTRGLEPLLSCADLAPGEVAHDEPQQGLTALSKKLDSLEIEVSQSNKEFTTLHERLKLLEDGMAAATPMARATCDMQDDVAAVSGQVAYLEMQLAGAEKKNRQDYDVVLSHLDQLERDLGSCVHQAEFSKLQDQLIVMGSDLGDCLRKDQLSAMRTQMLAVTTEVAGCATREEIAELKGVLAGMRSDLVTCARKEELQATVLRTLPDNGLSRHHASNQPGDFYPTMNSPMFDTALRDVNFLSELGVGFRDPRRHNGASAMGAPDLVHMQKDVARAVAAAVSADARTTCETLRMQHDIKGFADELNSLDARLRQSQQTASGSDNNISSKDLQVVRRTVERLTGDVAALDGELNRLHDALETRADRQELQALREEVADVVAAQFGLGAGEQRRRSSATAQDQQRLLRRAASDRRFDAHAIAEDGGAASEATSEEWTEQPESSTTSARSKWLTSQHGAELSDKPRSSVHDFLDESQSLDRSGHRDHASFSRGRPRPEAPQRRASAKDNAVESQMPRRRQTELTPRRDVGADLQRRPRSQSMRRLSEQ